MARRDPGSIGRLETVGAWLHVWTPPRDVEVPPVPKRKLAIGALVAAVVLGVVAAVAVPAIDTGKENGAAQRRAQAAALERAEARRLRIDQAPHRGAAHGLPAGLSGAARRRALEADLRAAITADARARVRAGKLEGPQITSTTCSRSEVAGEEHLAAVLGRYRCLAIEKTVRTVPGNAFQTGYPFVATIHYRPGTYVWCKTNTNLAEKAAGDLAARVKLSRSCAGPLADIL
jgi:hypothetical protein